MNAPTTLPDGLSPDDLVLPAPVDTETPRPAASSSADPPARPFNHDHSEHHPSDHPHEIHHADELQAVELQPSVAGFVEGWQLGLYRDAVVGGALAAFTLALLGVFIVLRRAVFVAATVGQAAGLGVVAAFYVSIHWGMALPPAVGALVFAALATSAVARLGAARGLPRDAGLGLGFLVTSAAAIALGDRITQEAHEVSSILFGSAVVVSSSDVLILGVLCVLVLIAVVLTWRGLAFAGFDPEGARVQNLPVRWLTTGFWLAVALAIAVCTRVLGALPVFAFSVLPPLAAIACTR
ncbi:MAG TPA: metal ABC transporter permease, partial [Polyangiaceae bacterium]|nr:metal ABC transporter permease [Polyangiaceae bacterium]